MMLRESHQRGKPTLAPHNSRDRWVRGTAAQDQPPAWLVVVSLRLYGMTKAAPVSRTLQASVILGVNGASIGIAKQRFARGMARATAY